MPELPEVETVRRGLAPAMDGALFAKVIARRPDLRFPLPERFVERLEGKRVVGMSRRGKFLVAPLDSQETLIMHLGMSGRFAVNAKATDAAYVHQVDGTAHEHVVFAMSGGQAGDSIVSYADPRRFGYMDLVPSAEVSSCRHFARMGPEPLDDQFDADTLREALSTKSSPLKAALLDQAVVAGLGNIYVCEALWRSKLSPRRRASTVGPKRAAALLVAIQDVLSEAIEVGGSSLRDHAQTDGAMGMFQHRFSVYDRAGQPCGRCKAPIQRITQSGRSTFFCGFCQR